MATQAEISAENKRIREELDAQFEQDRAMIESLHKQIRILEGNLATYARQRACPHDGRWIKETGMQVGYATCVQCGFVLTD